MITWAEQFKAHTIWEQLAAVGPQLDAGARRESLTTEQLDTLERIRLSLKILGERLAGAEPSLLQTALLNDLAEALRLATVHLEGFASHGDYHQVLLANTQMEGALNRSVSICVRAPNAPPGVADMVAGYRIAVAKQLEAFQEQAKGHAAELVAAEARLRELQVATATEQQRIGLTLTDWQTQFSSAQTSREQQHATQAGTFLEQFSAGQASRDQSHNDAQNARQTRFDDIHAGFGKKFQELSAGFDESGKKLEADYMTACELFSTEYDQKAGGIVAAIQNKQAQVEKLVGVIGNLGVTSGHQKAADQALRALRFWQGIAVLAMCSLIYIAYTRFLPSPNPMAQVVPGHTSSGFDWPAFALRVYVSLTIGVLAAYAGT